jgi:hypothetical protein
MNAAARNRHLLIAQGFLLVAGMFLVACGRRLPMSPVYAIELPYCESLHDGALAQPVNTVTNVFYAIAALLLFRMPARGPQAYANALGAWVLLLVGVGSAAFHGTMNHWAGILDNVAMNGLATLWSLVNVSRRFEWSRNRFVCTFAATNLVTTSYLVADDRHSCLIFAGLLGAGFLSEAVVRRSRGYPHLAGAIAVFLAASGVWALSRTGAMLCAPASAAQGHGLWHALTAVGAFLLLLHLRTEGTPESETPLGAGVGASCWVAES